MADTRYKVAPDRNAVDGETLKDSETQEDVLTSSSTHFDCLDVKAVDVARRGFRRSGLGFCKASWWWPWDCHQQKEVDSGIEQYTRNGLPMEWSTIVINSERGTVHL